MDNLPRSSQPKPRTSRLVWLRFPLLAALVINLVLIMRVPLVQITQGREASWQIAQAATTSAQPSDNPATSGSQPTQPIVVQAAPSLSSGGASQPAHSTQSDPPPRPSLSAAAIGSPRDPESVDITPAVKLAMGCIGECLANTTAARAQRANDLAEQIALSIGSLGGEEPVKTTSPTTSANDPPQVAVAPPAVSIDPSPAVAIEPPSINPPQTNAGSRPTTLAQSGQSDKSPAALPIPDEDDPPRPPAAEQVNIVLSNSARSQNVFHFVLDGQVVSLNPGEQHRIESSGRHVVRFHRGAQFGYADFVLENGNYEFRVSNRGWQMAKSGESR